MTASRPNPRLAVLLSGSGRTLINLQDHIIRSELPASIELVIASKEGLGAQRARDRNLKTMVIPGTMAVAQFEQLLAEHSIDYVVLAGYLKKLPVPSRYRGKILNIHPALLPKFGGHGMYGHHVHAAVLAAGEIESGCTVHIVDDQYDTGPILLQLKCPVLPRDTPDTLAARVFEQECIAYPRALKSLFSNGRTAQN